jgi:glycerol-3-phosphate acyltransferase PlsY
VLLNQVRGTATVLFIFGVAGIGYVIGSFPTAYVVMRAFTGRDIRAIGTGNVTSTAVTIHGGKLPGTVSLSVEILKVFLCLYIAHILVGELWAHLLILASAAVGQIWSVWLKGDGGMGQTIFITGFLVLCPIPFAFAVLVLILALRVTRRAYLSNQIFHIATPFCLTLATVFNPTILGVGDTSWGFSVVGTLFCILFFIKQRRDRDDILQARAWGTYSR